MKNYLIILAILFASHFTYAQSLNLGGSIGLPIADASDFTTFQLLVEGNYLSDVSESFSAGGTLGLIHTFGEDLNLPGINIEYDDVTVLPLAASGRLTITDSFAIGADAGYAIGLGNDGGLYAALKGQYELSDLISLVLAYRTIDFEPSNLTSITAGIEIKL